MTKPIIHPNWDRDPVTITEGFSLEITTKDVPALEEAAHLLPRDTPVAVTFLPGEAPEARIKAATTVRQLGFEPMPHFSARRLSSYEEFRTYLEAVVDLAGVRRCFVIAGDPPQASGPFPDSASLIATGAFENAGVRAIGVGGHPEGHPHMSAEQRWSVLANKCRTIEERGMAPLIVTQFGFDAAPFLAWLAELRKRGIDVPVRIGVPGPAGIKTLLRFAAMCGVGASASVLAKYGISITRLIGTAGPDRLVDNLAASLGPQHGPVRLHFYPFGGLHRTIEWVSQYAPKSQAL